MSSINGFNQHSARYQTPEIPGFDSDKPKHNPLDGTAGDDAEFFDPNTQTWQPTQKDSDNKGHYKNLGDPYREPIDTELYAGAPGPRRG